jgi:hypothetical protein
MINEFTQLAIEVQNAIANGEYTHQKYLRFREWYFQQHTNRRTAIKDFAMFDLMYGLDFPIKNNEDETI